MANINQYIGVWSDQGDTEKNFLAMQDLLESINMDFFKSLTTQQAKQITTLLYDANRIEEEDKPDISEEDYQDNQQAKDEWIDSAMTLATDCLSNMSLEINVSYLEDDPGTIIIGRWRLCAKKIDCTNGFWVDEEDPNQQYCPEHR